MRHPVVLATTLFSILLALCAGAPALDPSLDVSQYAHTAWKVRDGFAKGAIVAIAQTPDGYLWLGTDFGLLRFDGVRAVPWQPPNGEQLPSNFVTSLLVSRDGTLWIGTLKGLASWKDDKLTQHPEVAGVMLGWFLEDREQTVWFGTWEASKARLCAIRDGKVDCYGSGTFGNFVKPLYQDHKGNLWVSDSTGLWHWAPGPPERYPLPSGVTQIIAAVEDETGNLLLSTNDGLKRLVAGKIEDYRLPGITGHFTPTTLLRSRDGSLWISTSQGLLHMHQGKVDIFRAIDGLSSDNVDRILEDHEGSIWVATTDGLDRFREYAVPTISRKQGLSNASTWAVQATPDGSIWIGTAEGLNRWTNGQVTVYRGRSALGQTRQADESKLNVSGAASEIANSGLVGSPRSLGLDDAGRLWASTDKGVFYSERDRFVQVPGVPGGNIFSIAGDGHGSVWILNGTGDISYWSPNATVQRTPLSQFAQKTARAMLPDHEPGGLWLGFFEGGVVYLRDGKVVRSYGPADGLGDGRVTHLRFGPNGGLWASTEGGLSRIKDGHIATLTQKNGPPCDEVHWSIEDNDHAVWLSMPCGLVRIARSELNAWINDPKYVLKTTVFDNSDGVRGVGVYGAMGPHVTKSADGKIWFVFGNGVSVIDPHHIPFNKLPPPVHIEQIVANRKSYAMTSDASGKVRLPPRIHDLQIDYTALSFVAPEKVLFLYKLEGWDRDWQDADTHRQAFYGNLPPRNYRFRVMACNNSGVWNEAGTFLDFSIAPAYFQTWWFRSLCVLAFLALGYGAYRVRVGQLRAQEEKFREAIEFIPAMAFVSLPDGYRTFVNKGWVEYTGMTVEQSLGSGWHAAIHPEDLKRVLGEWDSALASGEPMYYEARYRRAEDGEYRWFLVRVVPQRNKRGKIVKWFGTLTDIEDSKRAGEALHRSQFYINEGQRVAQMGSWAFNAGGFEYWSSELLRIHGLDPSGKPPTVEEYLALIHPEDREFMKHGMAKMLNDHLAFDFTKRVVGPDGAIRHIRCVGVPVTQGGIFQGFLGTGMDVTEQERLTAELRLSERNLSEAQSLAHTGSCAIDGKSRETLYWSDEMFRLFGFDPQQGLPMFEQWIERIHPEDRDKVERASERTFLTKANCDLEFRVVQPDGAVKHIHGIGHPVLGANGELVQVLGTMVDVTELKRSEEEREKLRQLEADLAHIDRVSTLGEMAASLAHEIKQPLAAAITSANTCIEWLAHEPPNLDRARAAAARIDQYGNRAAEIIDRIRSFYKKSPPQRELVDMNGIIQEMLTLLKGEADRYSVAMHTELAAELPRITVDRVQLQQVFMNLILNAIEAMKDAGGELTVKSELHDGRLQFSVSDTGVGLPREKMDQIFSAFFTTKPHGSGMGLAISRSIVESHGGRLWASTNHGRGATFLFTLPLAVEVVQIHGTGTGFRTSSEEKSDSQSQ